MFLFDKINPIEVDKNQWNYENVLIDVFYVIKLKDCLKW